MSRTPPLPLSPFYFLPFIFFSILNLPVLLLLFHFLPLSKRSFHIFLAHWKSKHDSIRNSAVIAANFCFSKLSYSKANFSLPALEACINSKLETSAWISAEDDNVEIKIHFTGCRKQVGKKKKTCDTVSWQLINEQKISF